MIAYPVLLSLMWALCAAGLAWYAATITRRITYVTLADGRRKERLLPISFRLLLPLVPNITPLIRKATFAKSTAKLDSRIVSAGFGGLISATELMALRVLLPVVPGLFWILFVNLCVASAALSLMDNARPFLCLVGPLWLLMYPSLWLRSVVAKRHGSIRRSLPFVLDLLTLSVEAGMDFMTALQRSVESEKVDALGEELIRVIREIQLGKTRREALRDTSRRVNFSDLRSIVNALVQADELGVSIGTILRIQSDQIRQRRFERAEKLANEAPVKMLFPLIVCIFPAVFLILLGPVMARLVQQVF